MNEVELLNVVFYSTPGILRRESSDFKPPSIINTTLDASSQGMEGEACMGQRSVASGSTNESMRMRMRRKKGCSFALRGSFIGGASGVGAFDTLVSS